MPIQTNAKVAYTPISCLRFRFPRHYSFLRREHAFVDPEIAVECKKKKRMASTQFGYGESNPELPRSTYRTVDERRQC